MAPVLAETTVDIEFGQGEMGGSAGCNRYFGRYTSASDNRLTVGSEIGSTQMACPAPIAEQERQYLGLLSRVSAWQRRDESLLLVDEDGELLLQYTAAKPIPLEGTPWQAVGINNGRGGVVSSNITRLATAVFADGKISGNASCNRFSASYEIQGDRITIGQVATTRKQCPESGVMEQERQYLQALRRARTVTLTSDKLELRDENGSLQVTYRVANP